MNIHPTLNLSSPQMTSPLLVIRLKAERNILPLSCLPARASSRELPVRPGACYKIFSFPVLCSPRRALGSTPECLNPRRWEVPLHSLFSEWAGITEACQCTAMTQNSCASSAWIMLQFHFSTHYVVGKKDREREIILN